MKQSPISSKALRADSGDIEMSTPNVVSKSLAPVLLDTLRLPCLAILKPKLAPTIADVVDILIVFAPSPPVPTISAKG